MKRRGLTAILVLMIASVGAAVAQTHHGKMSPMIDTGQNSCSEQDVYFRYGEDWKVDPYSPTGLVGLVPIVVRNPTT